MTGPRPAGDPWTVDDDRGLMAMIEANTPVALIARKLKRTVGAVQSRRSKLRRLACPATVEAASSASNMFTRRGLPVRDGGRRGDAGAD